jgi:glucan phosphorylase
MDMRIHQEIMLGIGGVQMLKALGTASDGIPHE